MSEYQFVRLGKAKILMLQRVDSNSKSCRDRSIGIRSFRYSEGIERKEGTNQYKHAALESASTVKTCNLRAKPHVLSSPTGVFPHSRDLKNSTWSVVGI